LSQSVLAWKISLWGLLLPTPKSKSVDVMVGAE